MTNQGLPQPASATQLPPPFVNAPGLSNFRDAGGHSVTAGDKAGRAVVRRGVLFRSAEIGVAGGEALRQLGITRVFDLRSATESGTPGYRVAHGETPAPPLPESWAGIERVWTPVFLDQDYSPEAIALRYQNYSNGTQVSEQNMTMTNVPSEASRTLRAGRYQSGSLIDTPLPTTSFAPRAPMLAGRPRARTTPSE